MDFRVLGPLEAFSERGKLELGGPKPRVVLGVLLLHANEPVSVERLAIALEGEDAPASAPKRVQVHISRLRKALGDGEILTRGPAGYRLRVRPGELDSERFRRLFEDGRRALARGRSEHAATVLREALALWRGSPLAELAFEPFEQTEIARLEELRLAAVEACVEADLAGGRHAALVGELRQLVADNPTRERLVGHLMIALYRCGRQAEALETYREARSRLVEVGVEPGPELRRLQMAILRQDVSLEARPAEANLPPALDSATAPPLVGRDAELAWLLKCWDRARDGEGVLVTVTGAPGMGKTRLFAELAGEAHRLGAAVLYAAAAGPAQPTLEAIGVVREAADPTLFVVDDTDQARPDVLAKLNGLTPVLSSVPVLALAGGENTEALARLRSDGSLRLEPLDAEAVRAIAALYAPRHPVDVVPAEWLLKASGGVPRRVHEVASQWARREAAGRVGAAAGRAAAGRVELRAMETELADDVVELQAAGDRAEASEGKPDVVVCPFKGLATFDVADAEYFFGRERLVAEMVARLAGSPLLGVVGPSGSGKSSVVRAGVVPALANGTLPGSEDWALALLRPGEHPVVALEEATAEADARGRLLIVVDQFEETFTLCDYQAERSAFIDALVAAARDPKRRAALIIAVRADFYGQCASYPELSRLLGGNHVLVGRMRRDELRRAIELPARRAGLRVEPELVDRLLADVDGEPGALPMLSTALLELWQQRDRRHLTVGTYEATGGVLGAVARLAEAAYARLDSEQRPMARSLLLRLADEGEGTGVVRRRLPLEDLDPRAAPVLAVLAEARLVTVSEGAAEVAHEALLREWPRLRGWLDDSVQGRRLHHHLALAAREWDAGGRDPGELYRGARLTSALDWSGDHDEQLNPLERAFLDAGDARRRTERAALRRRRGLAFAALTTVLVASVAVVLALVFTTREKDIAASRDLATKSSTLLATDPGLALAIALEALRRSETEQAQNAVRQSTLAHRATQVITAHKGLAFGVAPSPDGRAVATAGGDHTVRIWSVASGRQVGEIGGYGEEVRAVSFSPDGRSIASAARDGEIAVAAAGGGPRHVVTRLAHDDFAYSIDFSADGKTLAIGTLGGCVALVRLSDGDVRNLNSCPAAPIYAVDFDSDGRRVISAGADGFARIWNVAGGRPLELAHGGESPVVVAATFSPGDARVATTDFSGHVRLWDAGSGRRLRQIRVGDQPLASVRFSGHGRRIVTGAYDGVIYLVAARGGAVLAELRGHEGPARADFVPRSGALVSAGEEDGTLRTWLPPATRVPTRPGIDPVFSRDDSLVASGDLDGPIHVWKPTTGEEREWPGHKDVSSARFSPDGRQIVSASHDETVRLWDVKTGRSRVVPTLGGWKYAAAIDASGKRIAIGGETQLVIQAPDGTARLRLRGHRGYVNALAFSPDSQHLVTGSDDETARVWNARSGVLERTLRGHEGIVRGVSYSDDGRWIATAGGDGTARVWRAYGGDPVILVGHAGPVNTARFDGRGDRLVTAGDDGTVRVWDTAGGDALVVLHQHEGSALGAELSDDGRRIVSAGDDGMRVTPCEVCGTLEDTLRVARTRAQHKLSAAERQRLMPGG